MTIGKKPEGSLIRLKIIVSLIKKVTSESKFSEIPAKNTYCKIFEFSSCNLSDFVCLSTALSTFKNFNFTDDLSLIWNSHLFC